MAPDLFCRGTHHTEPLYSLLYQKARHGVAVQREKKTALSLSLSLSPYESRPGLSPTGEAEGEAKREVKRRLFHQEPCHADGHRLVGPVDHLTRRAKVERLGVHPGFPAQLRAGRGQGQEEGPRSNGEIQGKTEQRGRISGHPGQVDEKKRDKPSFFLLGCKTCPTQPCSKCKKWIDPNSGFLPKQSHLWRTWFRHKTCSLLSSHAVYPLPHSNTRSHMSGWCL